MRKSLINDKRGLSGTVVLIIVALLVVIAIMTVTMNVGQRGEPAPGTAEGCPEADGVLTINSRSALVGGVTPPGIGITCGSYADGAELDDVIVKTSVTSGTTTFPVGTNLYCLINASDYIDTAITTKMNCGGTTVDAPMLYSTSDNPVLTIKDPKNGDATVTDAIGGGATNLTDPSAGASVKFDAYFEGTSGEGTGDLIYVVEYPAGSGSNITDVTMGTLESVNVPKKHVSQNAGSTIVAFRVPNINNAVEESYSVIASLGTGLDLTGGVYTDWYSAQDLLDDDDTIRLNDVEDSDGTVKYENTADRDFYIV